MAKLNEGEPPKDERLFGEAKFNYTSHDGRFVIGSAPWAFETSWTAAGQGSAHLYNDPFGIDGVAIAEGISGISQVTPDVVATSDFTSRTRTPKVGQIALLRNTEDFYAAVELLEVGYSSMPSGNIMRMRFAICTDRTADFSHFSSRFDDRQAVVEQLIAAASDAEKALRAVPVGEDDRQSVLVGIGHNKPPAEFAITKADQAETLEAIAIVKKEALSGTSSLSTLQEAGQTIARTAANVTKWLGGKLDVAIDAFAKKVGSAAGVTVVGTCMWLTLQDKLIWLIDMLKNFIG